MDALRCTEQIAILHPEALVVIATEEMILSEQLQTAMEQTQSVVQQQLLREDVARVQQLEELAGVHSSYADFEQQGLFLGWTQGDFRTTELHDTLKPLLQSLHGATRNPSEEAYAEVRARWITFNQDRSKRLVGCL